MKNIQNMSDKIEVHIRINSLVKNNVWKFNSTRLSRIINNKEILYENFVNILSNEDNKEIYEKCLTLKINQQENCTIFAYGQTGSGKTYTMLGNNYNGMIMYTIIDLLKNQNIEVSYIEIYNEKIFDLNTGTELKIYTVDNKPVMNNLSTVYLKNNEDAILFLESCEKNRKYGCTEYNLRSSRSHTIFQIFYYKNNKKIFINLIDLAGSEKVSQNETRRKEGAFINKSLLALCTVVNNLKNKKYFGFRDSKLTRLLQNSLNGETNIIALCTISPADNCVEESLSTLSFASRLGNIDFKKINIPLPPKEKAINFYQTEKTSTFSIHKSNLKRGFFMEQFLKLNMLHKTKEENIEDFYMLEKEDDINLGNFIDTNVKDNAITKEDQIMYELENDNESNLILDNKPFDEKNEYLYVKEKMLEKSTSDNKHKIINLLLERIESLEKMIHNVLKKNPNKRMKDIFILEKHMFNLKYKKFED